MPRRWLRSQPGARSAFSPPAWSIVRTFWNIAPAEAWYRRGRKFDPSRCVPMRTRVVASAANGMMTVLGAAGHSSRHSRFVGRRGMVGIERFAGLEHAKAQVQQLAHRGSDDLLGLEPALVLQALAQGGHQRVPADRGESREVEGRAQGGVADPGDPRRRIERRTGLPMARIETG